MQCSKRQKTSYQLTSQCQVFLAPAAETSQFSSGTFLGQRASYSHRPQNQALLTLSAELQLTQVGHTRLQALLGSTALHSHRKREGTMHASQIQGLCAVKANYFLYIVVCTLRLAQIYEGKRML